MECNRRGSARDHPRRLLSSGGAASLLLVLSLVFCAPRRPESVDDARLGRDGQDGYRVASLHDLKELARYPVRGPDYRFLEFGGFSARLLPGHDALVRVIWSAGLNNDYDPDIPDAIYEEILGPGGGPRRVLVGGRQGSLPLLLDVVSGPDGTLQLLWTDGEYPSGRLEPHMGRTLLQSSGEGAAPADIPVFDDISRQNLNPLDLGRYLEPSLELLDGRHGLLCWLEPARSPKLDAFARSLRANPVCRPYDDVTGEIGGMRTLTRRSVAFMASASGRDGAGHVSWFRDGLQYRSYRDGRWTGRERVLWWGRRSRSWDGYIFGLGMTTDRAGAPVIAFLADMVEAGMRRYALWVVRRTVRGWSTTRGYLPASLRLENRTPVRLIADDDGLRVHVLFRADAMPDRGPGADRSRPEDGVRPLLYAEVEDDHVGTFSVLRTDTGAGSFDLLQDGSGVLHILWNETAGGSYRLMHATLPVGTRPRSE